MAGNTEIGIRLRLFRKNNTKLTQNEIGEILGVKGNVIGRIESGDIGIDIEKLQILNIHYEINLNWLILGKGTPQYQNIQKSQVNNLGDSSEQTNFIGDLNESVGIIKEPAATYSNTEFEQLKSTLKTLTTERDLYKKLCEKSEIEIEFYKSQLKK